MASLRATFHYSVRELLVRPDLLGSSREFAIGDYLIRIVLPLERASRQEDPQPSKQALDALFPAREPAPDLPDLRRTSLSIDMDAPSDIAEVKFIRVEVFFDDQNVAASNFAGHQEPKESPSFDPTYDALRHAEETAKAGLELLLEWIRVRGRQHWIGLGTEPPEGLGAGELVDLDAGHRIPVAMGLRPGLVIRRIREEQVLGSDLFDDTAALAGKNERPSLADSLLSDALFMAQDAEPVDLPRAVLVAAIACELKVKTILREAASDAQRGLVDALLSNPRDWALSALAHFDRPLKAVAGVSLREADPPLWKRVDLLFQRRNKLAHRGEVPSEEDALDSVKAAVAVFRWFRTLPPQAIDADAAENAED